MIDDVILGCANQAGEDNRNVARMAGLLAGLPVEVAGQTVNRLCGWGLQAINSAAHAIMVGDGDAFVAGGVESMTRAPYVMAKPEAAFDARQSRDSSTRPSAGASPTRAWPRCTTRTRWARPRENVAEQCGVIARGPGRLRARDRQQRAVAAIDGGPLRRTRSCR